MWYKEAVTSPVVVVGRNRRGPQRGRSALEWGPMKRNRILRYLLAAFLVTLGLLTRHSQGVALAQQLPVKSPQPRIVAISPLGTINRRQIFQILINQLTGQAYAYGYFNYIHGLNEKDLYLEESGKPESKALFTLFIDARITRLHIDGPTFAYELLGHSVIYFNDTPHGDFSDPNTFREGTPIATGEENIVFTYDFPSGSGTGDLRLRQTAAFPNEFRGGLIQFGEVGNHSVIWRAKTLSNNCSVGLACIARPRLSGAPTGAVPPHDVGRVCYSLNLGG